MVKLATVVFTKLVEVRLFQHLIQPLIKRMPRRLGLLARIEQLVLLLSILLGPHGHV
jgi:hypothetical protein